MSNDHYHEFEYGGERIWIVHMSAVSYNDVRIRNPYMYATANHHRYGTHDRTTRNHGRRRGTGGGSNEPVMKGTDISMQEIREQRLTGERALFQQRDARIVDCVFEDGESPLKESRNIEVADTVFRWKYPLWYSEHVQVTHSLFDFDAHAAFWYSKHMTFRDCTIQAPKEFRRNRDVVIEDTAFTNAAETLWECSDVTLRNVSANGDYFAMNCSDMRISDFQLTGNYCFDGARNIVVERARLLSKDAFWNCENVTVRDSFISGEYLAWNTKNITFEHCTIESLQGLCYIDGLTMRDCSLVNTTRAFEYCTNIDADITTRVDGIVNPVSGTIRAAAFGDVVQDDPKIDTDNVTLITKH